MTCRTFKHAALLSLLAAFVAGCQGSLTDADPDFGDPLTEIFDGTNNSLDANERVFFLPPMVANPAPPLAELNQELGPIVTICSGPGPNECDVDDAQLSEEMSVEIDHYQFNWDTKGVGLGKYTVNVHVSGKLLAWADVELFKKVKGNGRSSTFSLKQGSTLPVKVRIEVGAMCDLTDEDVNSGAPCAAKTIDLTNGGTVSLDVPDGNGGTSVGVDVAGQENAPKVTFVVEPCAGGGLLLDIPVFGPCLDIVAKNQAGEPLDNTALSDPAIVFVCIEPGDLKVGSLSGEADLTAAQLHLIRIHRKDDGGDFQALPLAAAPCATLGGSAAPTGLMRFARFLGDKVVSLLGPKPLHARRRRIDFLQGGAPPAFSQFQWALPAKMAKVDGTDDQIALLGVAVSNDPAVFVSDADGFPVKGATVTFAGVGDVVVPVNPAPSNEFGIATVDSWTPPAALGEYELTASGFGIADPDMNGPLPDFDPFTPEPGIGPAESTPDIGDEVTLATGSVTFTAFTKELVAGTGASVTVDVNNYELTINPDKLDAATFAGTGLLFNGSISYGTDDPHVLIYNTSTGVTDFTGDGIERLIPGPVADHQTRTVMTELGMLPAGKVGLGLVIVRETFAFRSSPDDDFVIVKYTLNNNTGSAVSGLHVGQIIDADLAVTQGDIPQVTDDDVEFVSVDQMVRVTSTNSGSDPRVGFILLGDAVTSYQAFANPGFAGGFAPVDPANNAGWFGFLSSGIVNPNTPFGPADIRFAMSHGPVSIAIGGTRVIAFALLGGTSNADLSTNATVARAKWATLPQGPSTP